MELNKAIVLLSISMLVTVVCVIGDAFDRTQAFACILANVAAAIWVRQEAEDFKRKREQRKQTSRMAREMNE